MYRSNKTDGREINEKGEGINLEYCNGPSVDVF